MINGKRFASITTSKVNPKAQQLMQDKFGIYHGSINPAFDSIELRQFMAEIKSQLAAPEVSRLSNGPDYVVRTQLPRAQAALDLTIKVFKPQNPLKDWYDRRHKSKAERSYNAGLFLLSKGINTPAPIAWFERWEGNKLCESYFISEFKAGESFRDALSDIYYRQRDNAPLMDLLHLVAPAIRQMHDAGFMHGDMGNQNILLPKDENGHYQAPCFIDLNRARYSDAPLTDAQRAHDLARIALPGAYLKIFKTIYNGHAEFTGEIEKLEQKARKKFWNHRKNGKWRHPIRHLKHRNKPKSKPIYPPIQDIWLWDEKSAQPMIVPGRQEKHAYRNWGYMFSMLWQGLRQAPSILKTYKQLLGESFSKPVAMNSRIGIALHPKADYVATELALLEELGNPPVLVRICHHETREDWARAFALIDQLHARGIEVMLAILQDRQALLQPDSWQDFLSQVFAACADKVTYIEITHATNRLKWGVWSSDEFAQLMQPAYALAARYPKVKLAGPACIDFEYLPVIAALNTVPKTQPLAALSHLLYVDRRGAPENFQGKYSTLEKAALLKAVARTSSGVSDNIIVSEVNWPVKHTGIYSPIGCPYETPKWRREEPGESDEDYANYLVRYYLLCLCSGHVEQVFWWRLSAHGYGLVDDLNDFAKRPAFFALKQLLHALKNTTFTKRHESPSDEYWLEFSHNPSGNRFVIAWTTRATPIALAPELLTFMRFDRAGHTTHTTQLTGAPIYIALGTAPVQDLAYSA